MNSESLSKCLLHCPEGESCQWMSKRVRVDDPPHKIKNIQHSFINNNTFLPLSLYLWMLILKKTRLWRKKIDTSWWILTWWTLGWITQSENNFHLPPSFLIFLRRLSIDPIECRVIYLIIFLILRIYFSLFSFIFDRFLLLFWLIYTLRLLTNDCSSFFLWFFSPIYVSMG